MSSVRLKYAAATDDVRYYLNGLYFNLLDDRTEVVATDAIWLSLAYCDSLESPDELEGFIVPLKAIKEIERTFAQSETVNISMLENQILFSDETSTLTTRVIEGDYPNYQGLIPETVEGTAVVPRSEFLKAVRRVALLSNPKSHAITLDITTDEIIVFHEVSRNR